MAHKLRRILKTGTYMTRRLQAGAEVSFIPEHYGKLWDKVGYTAIVVPDYEAPREEAPKRRGRPAKAKAEAPAPVVETDDADDANDTGGEGGEGGGGNKVGATGTADLAPPPAQPADPAQPQEDPRTPLRALYEKIFGKKPFMGWSADDLQKKIDESEKE